MSHQENTSLLSDDGDGLHEYNPDEPLDDSSAEESQSSELNEPDFSSSSAASLVQLHEDGVQEPQDKIAKKKKKKVVKKTMKRKKHKKEEKGDTEDGVDQPPIHPDEVQDGNNPDNNNEDDEGYRSSAFDDKESIEDHAGMVTQILVPVCITMAIVIAIVKIVNPPQTLAGTSTLYFENANDSNAKKFGGALLNALIFVGMMVLVTVIFVLLYKYRCMKILYGWLGLSTIMLMGGGFGAILWQMIVVLNTNIDWLSFAILIWNFGVVGMTATFWYAPIKVNQMYMIAVSSIMAVLFTRLPEWTTWTILAAVAIYDLFAVLCPKGPLRVLVETAQQRGEPIPALIYNASVTIMMASPSSSSTRRNGNNNDDGNNDNHNNGDNGNSRNEHHQHIDFSDDEDDDDPLQVQIIDDNGHEGGNDRLIGARSSQTELLDLDGNSPSSSGDDGERQGPQEIHTNEDNEHYDSDGDSRSRGVKLGLGDFVFYSVLVGRAALFDMLTVCTAFVGIITGLFGTILLLALWKKALPALPLSIFFGVIFFFCSRFLLLPFAITLTSNAVVV